MGGGGEALQTMMADGAVFDLETALVLPDLMPHRGLAFAHST